MTACGQGARWLIVERGDQKEATWQQVPVQKPQTERQAMRRVMPEFLVLGPTHLQFYLMCSQCQSHIIWRSIVFVSMQQCRTQNTAADLKVYSACFETPHPEKSVSEALR